VVPEAAQTLIPTPAYNRHPFSSPTLHLPHLRRIEMFLSTHPDFSPPPTYPEDMTIPSSLPPLSCISQGKPLFIPISEPLHSAKHPQPSSSSAPLGPLLTTVFGKGGPFPLGVERPFPHALLQGECLPFLQARLSLPQLYSLFLQSAMKVCFSILPPNFLPLTLPFFSPSPYRLTTLLQLEASCQVDFRDLVPFASILRNQGNLFFAVSSPEMFRPISRTPTFP